MKVGYADWEDGELIEMDHRSVGDAAQEFAELNHQVDEASDIDFDIVVIDDSGVTHTVEMTTEYDPYYTVINIKK